MSYLEQYLSDDQKREIAEEMFRRRLAEALNDDVKVSNFLYRMHKELVHDVIAEKMGDDWVEKIYEHTKKSITQLSSYDVFRAADRSYGAVEGPGRKYLLEAVEKHAGRIEGRVLKRIEELDDYDLGDILRSALAKRLGGES